MTEKKICFFNTKKYLREEEYFRQVQEALLKRLLNKMAEKEKVEEKVYKDAS